MTIHIKNNDGDNFCGVDDLEQKLDAESYYKDWFKYDNKIWTREIKTEFFSLEFELDRTGLLSLKNSQNNECRKMIGESFEEFAENANKYIVSMLADMIFKMSAIHSNSL